MKKILIILFVAFFVFIVVMITKSFPFNNDKADRENIKEQLRKRKLEEKKVADREAADREVVNDKTFDFQSEYYNRYAAVSKNNMWGFIDKSGGLVVPAIYDDVTYFNEGIAAVKLDEKWGYVNTLGEIIAEPVYDSVRNFREGIAPVYNDGFWNKGWGFIDKTGELIIRHTFEDVSYFKGNYAIATVGKKELSFDDHYRETYLVYESIMVLINRKGVPVSKPYQEISLYREPMGLYQVMAKKSDEVGLIDTLGNIVLPIEFDNIISYNGDYAKVEVYLNGEKETVFVDNEANIIDVKDDIIKR
ncbi:MAG: WG repeat-containing protein [Bacteroidota bacterium]